MTVAFGPVGVQTSCLLESEVGHWLHVQLGHDVAILYCLTVDAVIQKTAAVSCDLNNFVCVLIIATLFQYQWRSQGGAVAAVAPLPP